MTEVEFETLEEEKSPAKQIIRWKSTDKYIVLSMTASTLLVWVILVFKNHFSKILMYDNGPEIIYVAKNVYRKPKDDNFIANCGSQFQNASNYDIYGTKIGAPLVLALLHYATLGFWTPAVLIFSLSTSIICALLFERFLSIWGIVQNPVLTACMLSIFPMRFVSLHSTLSTDAIYLSCVFVALIGYKLHNFDLIFYASLVSGFFDRQSIALIITFFVTFFYMAQYEKAFKVVFAGLISSVIIGVLEFIGNGDFFACSKRNYLMAPDFHPFPFGYMVTNMLSIATMENFHVEWLLFAAAGISTLLMSRFSFVLIVFPLASVVYTSCFDCNDLLRYSVVLEVFSVLVGFDLFISSSKFKKCLPFFLVLYAIGGIVFAINSIGYTSMFASDYFWNHV